MSSESDKVIFENSVDPQDNVNLFQTKKWTYITDSNNGTFRGQLQFDLNTLSSQQNWSSLSEAYVQFPIKLSIKNNSAVAPGQITALAATLKNGFHQFVDSVQIVLGGSTIQSSQIFTNIDTTYKILSEWSQDELVKYGPSLGIALDDYLGSTDTDLGVTESLDNSGAVVAAGGFNMGYSKNPGFKARMLMHNNNVSSNCLGQSILGTNAQTAGKSRVQAASSATANADIFVMYALGTVKLGMIADAVKKLPLVKGLKGFVYINYNAGTTVLTNNGSATISTVTNTATYGRCMPAMINTGTDGIALATSTAPVTFTAEISADPSTTLTSAAAPMTTARLVCPYYVASPEVDRALTQKYTYRYTERFVTQFNIAASGNVNQTLTPGISNPKRIILYPYFTGPDTNDTILNTSFVTNPLISALDSVPSTTSPFAALKELQFYVGNIPMFQSPTTLDYDQFLNEISEQGLDGGQNEQQASGLLSQRTWNQLYRYYTCDIGRRLGSEDGASKSVQVQCTNATKCPMTVIAIIWYDREITVDTAMGTITQGF